MNAVVADASPLIAFHQIGQLPLLQALFTSLVVPPLVAKEFAPSVPRQRWIIERQLAEPIPQVILEAELGPGETEAISLAVELHADQLIVDEKEGRHLAERLGLHVIEASMVGPLAVGVPTSMSQGFTVPASDVNRSRTYSIHVTVEAREASGTALNAVASLRVSFN